MEHSFKRVKVTKESTINDITSSIRDISNSLQSISESYRSLLKVNNALVSYCKDAKKPPKPDLTLDDEYAKEDIEQERKRKRQHRLETKRLMEEEYNRELQEKQYKRLMHLLNRSKFYASYIVDKINGKEEKDSRKISKSSVKKTTVTDENIPPQEKRKKRVGQNYDIRDYIPTNVQQKINSTEKNKMNLSTEEIEMELVRNSENEITKGDSDIEIPKYFNGELREYQREGFQWLKVLYENGINGILADEMGLGKTVQVIALLCHLIEKQQDGPYLIIAPLSTIPNWMIEFERFAPHLPVVVFHGNRDERLMLRKQMRQKYKVLDSYNTLPIVLTSFEMPLMEKYIFQSLHWRYIIIDEGHRIKNHECILLNLLKTCKSMNRLLLTGTPLQNNLAELWSLLNFLLPEIFDDLAVFESWFNAKELQYDEGTKKFLQLEEEKHVLSSLREILQPFMLRREKADVCIDIPPKKEVIVYAPLTKLQHDLYLAVLNRDIDRLTKATDDSSEITYTEDGKRPKRKCTLRNMHYTINKDVDEDVSSDFIQSDDSLDQESWKGMRPKVKNELMIWKQYADINDYNVQFFLNITMQNRLSMYKKIVNHPFLVCCPLDTYGLPKIDENLVKSSGKLLVLDALLPKLKERGHKILLFSTMVTILDMIQDYLSLRNYTSVRLDGGIKLEERKEVIKAFNENPDIFIFLISTRAGGVGLNLAAADTVIIYDSDWNPQADIQAMARCHRIGQTRPVMIYRLCTKGTIDENIITCADAKRVLEKMVISKKTQMLNIKNKETLLELQKQLKSDCQVVVSKNEAFTEDELNKLLDRSDMTPEEP
ncbi:lymphocyte-specific helicase [Calliopsis andreniformis]|uniref:lymphocyte-specific helicase n=1 Tax=Calliopsis andreniformis TaxID=337506 RepID=UPI003FCD313A